MVTSLGLYDGLLTLLAAERGVELALSRRNARRLFARGAVEAGRGHYRVMVILHGAFLISCALEPRLFHRAAPWPVSLVALVGALLSQALRYWAILSLGDRWNTRVLVLPGEPPVLRGPYLFLRHPNYVAVAVELACVPCVHGAYLTALLFSALNAALLTVRIRVEETALGTRYAQAFSRRPRFLPELFR